MRRTSKPVFQPSVKMEVYAGSPFSGTCRRRLAFFDCGGNTVPSES
ncbi:hypothetical protein HMPREF3038_00295 [Akkermansia sp. KLE1797]|nr:hypothetical protein HMPREF3038_00295 [Akkermansia sp. KLE1797]KXU54954.1 hypothetical protein HMPREF3039_00834 [Akkermansia sp. KLE1798]KZA04416.1 hypothetical protein HMPREF1326_01927 [Akkermansia sp. KLE1605]